MIHCGRSIDVVRQARTGWLFLVAVLLPVWTSAWSGTSWAQTGTFCLPTGGEAIQTNMIDYAPGEDVYISGAGFAPFCDLYIRVTRPNGTVIRGDGTSTPGMDIVTTDGSGAFASTYIRQIDSMSGEHVVDALDGEINVLAFAIFYNPEPPNPLACDYTVDPSLPADDLSTSRFKSIQSAVSNLPNPGPCTVHVLPGTYNELVNLTSKNTLATDPSQEILLQAPYGAVTVAPSMPSSIGITLTNSKFIAINGFAVKGSNVARGFSLSGASGSSNQDITIDGNATYEIGTPATSGSAGIFVGAGNPRTWIVNNLVRNNARSGIFLDSGSGPTYVVNNTIHQNGWNGVLRATVSGNNAHVYLINNLIAGNGTGSVSFGYGRYGLYQSGSGNAALATLRNNLFFQNGIYAGGTLTSGGDLSAAGILDATDATNYTTNGHDAAPTGPTTGIAGCTFADCYATHAFTEIFADSTDFLLLKAPPQFSPAIDHGLNSFFDGGYEWVPPQDLYGGPRVLDGDENGSTAADIGCHEAPGVDTAPPDTIVDTGPSASVNETTAMFTFHATEPGGTFQCQLDSDAIAPCNSRTVTYSGLVDGSHTFQVRATDAAGNADATPASRSWTIDSVPPDTFIDTAPPLQSGTASAAFAFHATETGSTFECGLDGAAFSACSSPNPYSGLANGDHVFRVRARDEAGNLDPFPASYTWTVTSYPDTSITVSPPMLSSSSSATFYFSSTKAGSTFECGLDASAYTLCASPATYPGLSDGSHAFSVKAVDSAGNRDPSPSSFSWTVDTVPSDTVIDSGPANPVDLNNATFGFHATETGGSFECSLDGSPFSSCSSLKSYAGLADGSHTFQVRARDQAGNVDPTPASVAFDWSVDTTTLTLVPNVTKTYEEYNQILYLAASISSSAGQVNEGKVAFSVKQADATVIGPELSQTVTGGQTLTYTFLPAGTPAGVYTIEARYSGGPNYRPSVGYGTLTIIRAPVTIALSDLAQDYDGTPKPASVNTRPPGIAVSITYNGFTTPPTDPGTYTVVASLANPNYIGPDATGILTIAGKEIPVITWSTPADIVYPTPLSSLQTNATANIAGVFAYTPPAGTVLHAGARTLRVDFTPADTATYMSTFKTVSINVLKGSQFIAFDPLADRIYGAPDDPLAATASSGLPVAFASNGNCTVTGGHLRLTGAGNCTVTASQGGDSNHYPAADVARTFTIAKAPATILLSDLTQIYDGSPKEVAAATDPPGLSLVTLTYNGASTPPAEAGVYTVVAFLEHPDFQAPAAGGTLTIVRADAGSDQAVDEGAGAVAVGSPFSYAPTYGWTQLAGPPAALSDPAGPTPSFPAPLLDGGFGSQVVTLQLTASAGSVSTSDTVNITVKNINHAPVTDAGDDQSVKEAAPVSLSGLHSYDPDGDPVGYNWVQTGGIAVTLAGADTAVPTFAAPLLPGGFGSTEVLTFQLTVSDGLLSDTKVVRVTVEQVNHSPTASAGQDQTWNEGSLVPLDGSGTDPDGDSLAYTWIQIGGPEVSLSSAQSATPSFVAPAVGPGGTTLVFQVSVSDGWWISAPDTVAVRVLNVNDPPDCSIARADQEDIWPPNHKLVPVAITGITDPNNDAVRITVSGVTQDEPTNGLEDGDTSPDAILQGDRALVRAERSGNGDGRVYTVHFTAQDGNGGSCVGSVRVGVPPNKRAEVAAVDNGQSYDSAIP